MCMVRPVRSRSESAEARLGFMSSSPPTWVGPEVALPLTIPVTEGSRGPQNIRTSGGDKIESLLGSHAKPYLRRSNGGNTLEEKENKTQRLPLGSGMAGHPCVELQAIMGGLPVGCNVEPCVKGKSHL